MPYTVKTGDNPWDVARKLGMTIGQYMALNPHLDRPEPGASPGTGFGLLQEGDLVYSPMDQPVDPGLAAQQWEAALALQERMAAEQIRIQEEAQADIRTATEAQLGANPADFVAYELYKRSLQEQGFTPASAARSDVEIQDLFSLALGLNAGETIGGGQFGVSLPTTGSISRSELQAFSPTDIGVLSSFLKGGVQTDGGFQGINPEDYFKELEEGLIPTLTPQRTQFRL